LLILVSEEFRQRLFVDIPFLQRTLDESKKALVPLQEERKKLENKIFQKEKELNQLKNNINEFRRGNIVIKRGQTLFIAEINSSSNIKLELTKIYNEADKFVRKIVIPINKEAQNILLWRPSDITKIQTIAARGGNWILLIKSATNVLKGDNYVFVSPDLLENKKEIIDYEDIFVFYKKTEIGTQYFITYKNYISKNNASEACDLLTIVKSCIILNLQN